LSQCEKQTSFTSILSRPMSKLTEHATYYL